MKQFLFIIALLAGPSAFACADITGTYMMGGQFIIDYQQKACETLTETWCGPDKNCNGDSHTWLMDGEIRKVGSNPHNWASIKPEGNSLRRRQAQDSGIYIGKESCSWQELIYSKDPKGNLNVQYELKCLKHSGTYESKTLNEVWKRL